jgi:hypothetical protein
MLTRKVGGEGAYIVKTRSGGYHTYFAWDEERFGDWKGTVGIEGFVDIRTTGNYVVGAHAPGYELLRGDINNLPPMPNDLYSFFDGKVGHKVERADTECSFTQASVTPLLEDMGFTGIHWLSGATSYDFECDQCRPQRGTSVGQCPCCGGFHEGNGKGGGNHFYVAEVGLGVLTVKNHGNCKPRQFRFEVGCLVTGITEKEQNEIKEGTSAGYIEVRREFEKHVAKILTKDLFCDDSCYGTTGEIAKFSEAALVRRYRELSFVDENGASDERLAHGATVLLDLELNFGEREKVLGIICLFKERIQTVAEVVVLRPFGDALPHCIGRDGLRRLVRLEEQRTRNEPVIYIY